MESRKSIDFDQLRQKLSSHSIEGLQERYHLDWPGKREALLTANVPIAETLWPCREESQKDEEGNCLVANIDSNGRFHSNWMSMIYSRLKLTRNLFKDDGIIFISIDD